MTTVNATNTTKPDGFAVGLSPWGTDGDYRWAAFRTGKPVAYGMAPDRPGAAARADEACRAAAWAGTH